MAARKRELTPPLSIIVVLGILLIFLVSGTMPLLSQDRCGTVEYINMLRDKIQLQEQNDGFEQWISKKIEDREFRVGVEKSTFKYMLLFM